MRVSSRKLGAAIVLGALAIGALGSNVASANPIFRGRNFPAGIRNIDELPVCGFDCPTGHGPTAAISHDSEFTVWRRQNGSLHRAW